MTDIVLNETDREICEMAALVLVALEPGATREKAAERMMQCYRDDLSDAHSGADPDLLDEMTLGFSGALLLEMERLHHGGKRSLKPRRGVPRSGRRRVIEALHGYLQTIDPRH
jgi:hypothetical protein